MPRRASRSVREMSTADVAHLDSANSDMVRQIEEVCRSWTEAATVSMLAAEQELATQLVTCRSAEDALALCNSWMTSQLDRLVATQHRLIELWCSSVAQRSVQLDYITRER